MLNIAICDDEPQFLALLQNILSIYLEEKGVLYQIRPFASGKEFINLGIGMLNYQIIFLDIHMEGFDGLQTAQKIRETNSEIYIAFTTAFVTYLLEGYQVDAIRYILKDRENFTELVWECMDAIQAKMHYVVKKKTFSFKEGTKTVPLNRLLYIESHLHQLRFYIMEDSLNVYTQKDTLNHLEQELAKEGFLRLHQSYLANMKHIVSITRYKAVLNSYTKTEGAQSTKDRTSQDNPKASFHRIELDIPKARYKTVEQAFIAYKGEL